MSADNGVYILHTKDGYRVTHAQAIDNITYMADQSGFNLRMLYQYFNDSECYINQKEATEKAVELYEEIMNDDFCPICEYGISFITALNLEFPKECPPCCKEPSIVSIDGQEQCDNCGEWL
jgi:hypothetical protein